jgi:hypothetical protein
VAQLGSTDLHVHVTWDTEPTDKAKAFVKQAVIEALSEIVTDTAWLKEIVQAEVRKAMAAPVIHLDGCELVKRTTLHLRDRSDT